MPNYSLLERLLFPPTFVNRQKLRRELEGKTILITGASSGIGEQLAYQLTDIKVHLILVARRGDKLNAMRSQIETQATRVSVFPADLRDEKQMDGLLDFLHRLPDGLDIIVSNAGHSIRRSIYQSLDRYHDLTARWRSIIWRRSGCFYLPMLEQKQGHVINISTVNALSPPFTAK